MIHRDNAPSGSIHEEATNSVVEPFMGVFNNLVMFDQQKPINSADTIVADLATSWAWSGISIWLTTPSGLTAHPTSTAIHMRFMRIRSSASMSTTTAHQAPLPL